ncbi:MAG: asparagine synthase-related protein [Marinicellaceae bacterium]
MLILKNKNTEILKTWDTHDFSQAVTFTIHSEEILHYHEHNNFISIFYGFLDQECPDTNIAEYVSTLIQKTGHLSFNEFYGSFIVIHFDKIKQQYLIANDAMGDFAVHFSHLENHILISDFPEALIQNNTEIDHMRLLQYFAMTKVRIGGCFFNNITQLNPGHSLTITNTSQNINRYFFPKQTIKKTRESIQSLAERFKLLIQKVIAYQTKDQKKIGILLSGGMDSTFVAANSLKASKQVNSYSYVFPNMPDANESFWIDSMRDKGMDMHTFAGESHWPLKSPWTISLNAPINNPYRHLKSVIYQRAHSQGIKYLLTGVFADHIYSGYIYWLVDQIKFKPITAIKSLFQVIQNKGVMTGLRQVSPRKFSNTIYNKSPWMTHNCLSEINKHKFNIIKNNHPHTQQFDLVYGLLTAQSAWLENEHAYKHNVFVRHPFRDRRIIEFLMSLPAWILGDINNPKKFVRYTARNVLPQTILNRVQTTTLMPLFFKGIFEKEFEKLKEVLLHPEAQWPIYVKQDLILNIIKNPNHKHKELDLLILWQCLNFEFWRHRIKATSPK